MRVMLQIGSIAALLALPVSTLVRATAAQDTTRSVVVLELFTAEGCSSCPPADAFAVQLEAVQPIAGARIVVLSEHMDYWNTDWPDPYSSTQLTARQNSYIHARGQREPYTPQLLIDGTAELHLQDHQRTADILKGAAAAAKIPVRLSALSFESGTRAAGAPADGVLRGHIEVDGQLQRNKADVFVVVALNHVVSKVLRGENRGQTLNHVGVVEDLVNVGALTPGKTFTEDFNLPLHFALDAANARVVAFVQEAGFGKIVGAALLQSANSTAAGPAS